jgi:hypothetical protein
VPSVQFFTDVAGESGFIEVRDVGGTEGIILVAPGGENTSIILRQTNNMSLILDNVETLSAVADQIRFPDGDATAPGISWLASAQQDVGIFRADTDEIGVAVGGAEVARLTGTAGHNLQGLEWTTWTPTLGGITVGNGTTNYAQYVRIGDLVIARWMFTLGSTSAITGGITVSAPVTADVGGDQFLVGHARLNDSGTAVHIATVGLSDASTFTVYRQAVSGSNIIRSSLSSTTPFTWTTTDFLSFTAIYEAA